MVSCKGIAKGAHLVGKQGYGVEQFFGLEGRKELSHFRIWGPFFAGSFESWELCFLILVVFSSVPMFGVSENILINFPGKVTRSCLVDRSVPLEKLMLDLRFG
jgi:hypothetical protein